MRSHKGYEFFFFFFQAEDGIRDLTVTGVQTCALPISRSPTVLDCGSASTAAARTNIWRWSQATSPTTASRSRSEEHTSELQSQSNLVCRLLLEKKKNLQDPGAPPRQRRTEHLSPLRLA